MRRFKLSVAMMLGLIALIALSFGGLRYWLVDPSASRLPKGSVAILDPYELRSGASCAASYLPADQLMAFYFPVQVHSRVEIIDDTRLSQVREYELAGAKRMGDYREVKITVLEGAKVID